MAVNYALDTHHDGWDTMATSIESLETIIASLFEFKSEHEVELRIQLRSIMRLLRGSTKAASSTKRPICDGLTLAAAPKSTKKRARRCVGAKTCAKDAASASGPSGPSDEWRMSEPHTPASLARECQVMRDIAERKDPSSANYDPYHNIYERGRVAQVTFSRVQQLQRC